MFEDHYQLFTILATLPMAIVLMIGIVLILLARRRLTGRGQLLGIAGCAVSFFELIVNAIWIKSSSWILDQVNANSSINKVYGVFTVADLVLWTLSAVGIALLIAGLAFGGRKEATASTTSSAPQQPYGSAEQYGAPQQYGSPQQYGEPSPYGGQQSPGHQQPGQSPYGSGPPV